MSRLGYSTTERARIDARLDQLSQALATAVASIPTPSLFVGATWLDVRVGYGAAGNGIADDRTAITNALNAAAAAVAAGSGNVIVFFPAGIYHVSRSGSSAWSLDIPSGVTLCGVRGATWLKHPTGMPNASVAIVRMNERDGIIVRDIGFDGNWGATVGVTNSQDGINHTPQGDPSNHAVHVRGSSNVVLENIVIRQTYGDGVWVGGGSTTGAPSTNVHLRNVNIDVSARNGFTMGGHCDGVHLDRCVATNIYSEAFDTEPNTDFRTARNVTAEKCKFKSWWIRDRTQIPVSIVGSNSAASQCSAARGFRFSKCETDGQILISSAYDVVIEHCRVVVDTTTAQRAPIYVDHRSEEIVIKENYVYDHCLQPGDPDQHPGAITVRRYNTRMRPRNVVVKGNTISVHVAGVAGIAVEGCSGEAGESGTATGVSDTSLTDSGKAWATNQRQGFHVLMGGKVAAIESNDGTALSFPADGIGWQTPLGEATTAPSAGAYKILGNVGYVDVDDNRIDCGDDGNGAGGVGIYLDPTNQGLGSVVFQARARCRRNTIRNATGAGVYVQARNTPLVWQHLVVADNTAIDDQATPTCTAVVQFATSPAIVYGTNVLSLVMRNNGSDGSVATSLTGLSSAHRWIVNDGYRQEWAGFGAPTFSAPIGTRYWRVDGANASEVLYVNGSGGSTWTAK
jgi:hypothetical protein